jgi:hypothetical protein
VTRTRYDTVPQSGQAAAHLLTTSTRNADCAFETEVTLRSDDGAQAADALIWSAECKPAVTQATCYKLAPRLNQNPISYNATPATGHALSNSAASRGAPRCRLAPRRWRRTCSPSPTDSAAASSADAGPRSAPCTGRLDCQPHYWIARATRRSVPQPIQSRPGSGLVRPRLAWCEWLAAAPPRPCGPIRSRAAATGRSHAPRQAVSFRC